MITNSLPDAELSEEPPIALFAVTWRDQVRRKSTIWRITNSDSDSVLMTPKALRAPSFGGASLSSASESPCLPTDLTVIGGSVGLRREGRTETEALTPGATT